MIYHQTRAQRVLSAVLLEMNRQAVDIAWLAAKWGVDETWAAGRLSGKKGLTVSELGHIADALGVPVQQFDYQLAGV